MIKQLLSRKILKNNNNPNIMIKKSLFFLFLIVAIVFTLAPIFMFAIHFNTTDISNNIEYWGAFGSYIGGIVTPIVSTITVIILGYLTYFVGKNSNKENSNLFIQQKRIEAYDELTRLLVPFQFTIEKSLPKLKRFNAEIEKMDSENFEFEKILDKAEEIHNETIFHLEFYFNLYNFRIRYGYLFSYNFESNDYKELVQIAKQITTQTSSFYTAVIKSDPSLIQIINVSHFEELNILMGKFLTKLQDEINI